MRFNLKTTAAALTLATAGVVLVTAPRLRAADAPATVAPAAPVRLDDASDNAKRVAEIPNLRKARQNLYDAAKMLTTDVIDPKGYRHESLDYINKAISDLTNEINEYKGDEPPAMKK